MAPIVHQWLTAVMQNESVFALRLCSQTVQCTYSYREERFMHGSSKIVLARLSVLLSSAHICHHSTVHVVDLRRGTILLDRSIVLPCSYGLVTSTVLLQIYHLANSVERMRKAFSMLYPAMLAEVGRVLRSRSALKQRKPPQCFGTQTSRYRMQSSPARVVDVILSSYYSGGARERQFGVGYARSTARMDDLTETHTVAVPAGEDTCVLLQTERAGSAGDTRASATQLINVKFASGTDEIATSTKRRRLQFSDAPGMYREIG